MELSPSSSKRMSPVTPGKSFVICNALRSWSRVLDGFSALIDPSAIPIIERDEGVAGVFPVRVAYPASISAKVLARRDFGPSWLHLRHHVAACVETMRATSRSFQSE